MSKFKIFPPLLLCSSLFVLLCFSVFAAATFAAIGPNARVDCAPKFGEGKFECLARGCLWDDNYDKYHGTIPLCYFPPGTGYGLAVKTNDNHFHLLRLHNGVANPYGKDFAALELAVKQYGSALHISIYAENRFRPPVPFNVKAQVKSGDEQLFINVFPKKPTVDEMFYFTVERSDGQKIWDTSIGGLLFADQFIQIATYLPTDLVYGFGENAHQQLKHDFSKYSTWGMFTRDEAPMRAGKPILVSQNGPCILVVVRGFDSENLFVRKNNGWTCGALKEQSASFYPSSLHSVCQQLRFLEFGTVVFRAESKKENVVNKQKVQVIKLKVK